MNGRSLLLYYILTLISPVIGVFIAIKNLSWKRRRKVLIFAITLFGATIVLNASDGYVLKSYLYSHYMGLPFEQWWYELIEILKFSPEYGTKGDVYSHVLSYFVGHILRMPEQFFIFTAAIYAYFYVSSMQRVLSWEKKTQWSFLIGLLVIIFITYRFIDSLQSVRTYTGAWALFYGLYRYYETKKVKYLLITLFAPLCHVAYFLIALPIMAVVLLKKLPSTVFILLYFSSFFININHDILVSQVATTEVGESKLDGYYGEGHLERREALVYDSNVNFYARYGKNLMLYVAPHFLIFAIILCGLYSKRYLTHLEYSILTTGIFAATAANLWDFIPVLENRTMANAGIYVTATPVLLLRRHALLNSSGKMPLILQKLLLLIAALAFTPYLIYVLANMLQYTSIFMLIAPIAGLFNDFNLSLRELIRFFLF